MPDSPTTGWQKVSVLAGAVAAVFIPLALALVGSWTSTALKDQEIRGQFVQLAVSILQEPPTPENRSVREWAINVINRYSDVPLQAAAVESLKDSAALPQPVVSSGSGVSVTSAAAMEREAFGHLVAGDIDSAIASFRAADAAYPTYHNVHDIAELLQGSRERYNDPAGRREILRTIVTQHSWGAPPDLLRQLREQVGSQ